VEELKLSIETSSSSLTPAMLREQTLGTVMPKSRTYS
jgi:hypothetical protein